MSRAGLLAEVHPPPLGKESIRGLIRCREDANEDGLRSRHRLGTMLLRRGRIGEAPFGITLFLDAEPSHDTI